MLILSRNIVGILVLLAVVVISAQESEPRTNAINIGEERDSDDDVYYEADVTLQARDKRTIGAILSGVADLFGYDVQRRPSVFAVQAVPLASAQVQAAPADAGPALARQMAPAAPPPAAPAPAAPAPAAPVTPPVTLTDGVRRAFQVGVNWSNQRQQLGPPAAAAPAPAPAPAPAAPVPPPAAAAAPAAQPIQGERRSYTVGLNWQNLRQQLGAPAPAAAPAPVAGAAAAPAPAAAGPPPPQGFRQSYQLGFDFSNQRQQLGGPPAAAAAPPAAAAPAPAAAPPAGAPIANLGAGPPRVPQLLRQKPVLTPTLVERIYFDKSNAPAIKKVYYPKKTDFENRPPLNAKLDRDLEGERRPPVRLDSPPGDIDEPPARTGNGQEENSEEEEEEADGNEHESNDEREDRPQEIELHERIGKKEPPRGFQLEREGPPKGIRGPSPKSGWRKEETGDPDEETYVLEEDYSYGDKANKLENGPFKNTKKFRPPSESVNAPPITLFQLLSDDMPEEIRQFNREFNHHRSEEGRKHEPAPDKESAHEVTQATPAQNVETNERGTVHGQHQAILRDLVDNFKHQQRVLSSNRPSAPGVDKRKQVAAYHSKALDGIVKTFEKKARQELLGDKHLVSQHKQILEALKVDEKAPEVIKNNGEEPIKQEVASEEDDDEKVQTQSKNADEEQHDAKVTVGNEDVVGPNEEYINEEAQKQDKENDEKEEKLELKQAKGEVSDLPYFFNPTDFVKQIEKIVYADGGTAGRKDKEASEADDDGNVTVEIDEKFERVNGQPAEKTNNNNGEINRIIERPNDKADAESGNGDKKQIEEASDDAEEEDDDDDDGKSAPRPQEDEEESKKPTKVENNEEESGDDDDDDDDEKTVSQPENEEEDEESEAAEENKKPASVDNNEKESDDDDDDDEKTVSQPENEEDDEESKTVGENKKLASVDNNEKESGDDDDDDEKSVSQPENEEDDEESKTVGENKKPASVDNNEKESDDDDDEKSVSQPENEEKEEESDEESEEDEEKQNDPNTNEDAEETDERKQKSKAKEDVAEADEESDDKEPEKDTGKSEEEKRRKLDENEKALKQYINEHFEVDVVNGVPIPKGFKDSDGFKAIVERVKAPVDSSFNTIAPDFFGQHFENNLKKLEKADNKVEEDEEEDEADSDEEAEDEGETKARSDEDDGEQEQTEPEPQIKEDQSTQSETLQYPHERKTQELYSQFRRKFENPETQDSNKYEVVQANLHTGGFQPARVESLDNPGQLTNIPFEYDYSGSEKKVVVDCGDKVSRAKRATKGHVGEIVWSYQPERYDPSFKDDVIPEPKAEDLSRLEAKNYEEDDSLSPKAFVTENESGRKRTYIRVNKKNTAMFG